MPPRPRCAAWAALVVLCTATADATRAPSLEIDPDQSFILSVPAGRKVKVRMYDNTGATIGNDTDLVTTEDLDALRIDMMAELQMNSDNMQITVDEIKTEVSAVTRSVGKLDTAISNILDDLVVASDVRANATKCLSNIVAGIAGGSEINSCPSSGSTAVCPEILAPKHGSMKGKTRGRGSLRSFACAPGFQLDGSKDSVCGQDNKWSHATPTCYGTVTCKIVVDNSLYAAFVDGVKIPWSGNAWHHGSIKQFTFSANSKTLAIYAADSEFGCKSGGMAIICSSVGESSWHDVKSHGSSLNKWKAQGIKGRLAKNPDPTWATATFDDSKWANAVISGPNKCVRKGVEHAGMKDTVVNKQAFRNFWAYGNCDEEVANGGTRAMCPDEQASGNYPGYKDYASCTGTPWKSCPDFTGGLTWFFRYSI